MYGLSSSSCTAIAFTTIFPTTVAGNFLAQRLDMLGVNVYAACLTEAAQNRLKLVASSRLKTLSLDITKQDQIKQAVDFVRQNLPENEGAHFLHIANMAFV